MEHFPRVGLRSAVPDTLLGGILAVLAMLGRPVPGPEADAMSEELASGNLSEGSAQPEYRLFFSYRNEGEEAGEEETPAAGRGKDFEFASALCEYCKSTNKYRECWMAPGSIPPGAAWPLEIVRAISRCTALVLMHSEGTGESRSVRSEVHQAFKEQKILLPIRRGRASASKKLAHFLDEAQWITIPAQITPKILAATEEQIWWALTVPDEPPPPPPPPPPVRGYLLGLLLACLVGFVGWDWLRHGDLTVEVSPEDDVYQYQITTRRGELRSAGQLPKGRALELTLLAGDYSIKIDNGSEVKEGEFTISRRNKPSLWFPFAPKAKYGQLELTIKPSNITCEIRLFSADGGLVNTQPLGPGEVYARAVRPGTYWLAIEAAGRIHNIDPFPIRSGETKPLEIELPPEQEYGDFLVTIMPFGTCEYELKHAGTNYYEGRKTLENLSSYAFNRYPIGEYQMVVWKDRHPISRTFEVVRSRITPVDFDFNRHELLIKTDPGGAIVRWPAEFLDSMGRNEARAGTPVKLLEGRIPFTATLDGYYPTTTNYYHDPRGERLLLIRLRPMN
jgi:TIR domain